MITHSFEDGFSPAGESRITLCQPAGEQLVEIESLSEVDPAIFTALRNYSLEDISIRMPRDQLYDDELEENAGTQ